MRYDCFRFLALTLIAAGCLACSAGTGGGEVLFQNPVSDLTGVLTPDAVVFDGETTSDGNGALKIVATDSTTVRLFEVEDPDVENSRLVYRARLRTEGVQGHVFLEKWCRFPGLGEFFSRALHAPLSGSTDWTSQETPFFLEAGQNPDHVALNVVITGPGTVWVDEVELVSLPR